MRSEVRRQPRLTRATSTTVRAGAAQGTTSDMLIVNGDATTDPTDLRSVAMVIVKGESALDNTAIA